MNQRTRCSEYNITPTAKLSDLQFSDKDTGSMVVEVQVVIVARALRKQSTLFGVRDAGGKMRNSYRSQGLLPSPLSSERHVL